jgi:hypothetical protein
MIRNLRRLFAACATLLCWGTMTRANYASETGMIQIISPPPSVKQGELMSDTVINTFAEHHELTLTSNVQVDDTKAGTFTNDASLVGGTIASGTKVDSYLFTSNPTSPSVTYDASVTFSSAILGVIVLSNSLDLTDTQLGHAGTKYPNGDGGRGLELARDQDFFTLSADLKTLTFHFFTHGNVDEVRVITAATVPEPFSSALLGLGGFGLLGIARLRRKSARGRV